MSGGSQAARAVAGLILIKDSFAALPDAFREGQRIRDGLQDVLEILMVRIFGKALAIAAMLPFAGFPFAPRNSSLLSFLGAGVPVIGLTAWAQARPPLKGSIFRPLARFSLPLVLAMIPLA
jgi:cation-transporting ATPase E